MEQLANCLLLSGGAGQIKPTRCIRGYVFGDRQSKLPEGRDRTCPVTGLGTPAFQTGHLGGQQSGPCPQPSCIITRQVIIIINSDHQVKIHPTAQNGKNKT